ncbi:MAG: Fic family protein [Firmicutes bacterium]|nr:Fic family protein [Bacillota bacterium]
MTYKPPYTINSKMINYVSSIMKLIGQLSGSNNLDNKPQLRRTNKINSIYSSLAIENNSLSEKQVKDIINGKLVVGPKRDIIEVQNAIKVYDAILDINPLNSEDLLKYHGIMMKSLVDDAGSYRRRQEGVFDDDRVIFIAPPADRVPILMKDLFDYLNNYNENIIIKSVVFHYEFEFIHPFSDGNGRMGRLFQTCLLATEEKIFAYLPIESIINERQQEYYNAIAICNRNGNSDVFIEFMLDAILETVKRILKLSGKDSSYLNIQAKKLYKIMEENVPYTTLELMETLNMKSRASFKKNYLDPNLVSGLVEMTLPDTPNSRNQRYVKK